MDDLDETTKQFQLFSNQLEDSNKFRETIRSIISRLESVTRQMHSALLIIHTSNSSSYAQIINKANGYVDELKILYSELSELFKDQPGQYYRYNDHWRSLIQTNVFLIAFIFWIQNKKLIPYSDCESLLNLKKEYFWLELEDYLIGICNLSNELPRFVINKVTQGDYSAPIKVSEFLNNLNHSFRLLNLKNDFLRKRFDGLKYDLKRVEEIVYDVKIRGLNRNS